MSRPKPLCRDDFSHFQTVPTRWMDNDVYGHVNNVVYYAYFDSAVNSYLIAQGVLRLDGPVIGLVVETGCNYFSSVKFPDVLQIGLRVASIGKSSVRYELGVFLENEPLASANGHFIHVYVDSSTRRPVSLPDDWRQALLPLMHNEVNA